MEGDGAAGRGGQLGEGPAGDEAGWPIGAKGGWHGRRWERLADRGGRRVDGPSARKAIGVDGERRSSCCLPLYLNN